MSKHLSKITIYLTDLSSVQLDTLPDRITTLEQIVKMVMAKGAMAYKEDICVYVPPSSIAKIVFQSTDGEEDDGSSDA